MKVICPYCNAITEVVEAAVSRHNLRCQCCGQFFFSAGELTFRYGEMLDPSSFGLPRIACPYCHQHYSVDYIPFHNMIGCVKCLKIFVLPKKEPDAEVQPFAKTIVIPPYSSRWTQNPEDAYGQSANSIPVLWDKSTSSQANIPTGSGAKTTAIKPPAAPNPPDWQRRN